MAERQIKIGGEPRAVPRRTGFKATRVVNIAGQVSDELPEIEARARAERARLKREAPLLPITRDMAKLPRFAERYQLTEEDFETIGAETINVPGEVGGWEVFAAVFPMAAKLATRRLEDLLALILAENDVLQSIELDQGEEALDEHLRRERVLLMHKLDAGELLEAVDVVVEIVRDEMEGKDEQISRLSGNLEKLVETVMGGEEEEATDSTAEEIPERTGDSSDAPASSETPASTPSTSSESSSEEASATPEESFTGSAPAISGNS